MNKKQTITLIAIVLLLVLAAVSFWIYESGSQKVFISFNYTTKTGSGTAYQIISLTHRYNDPSEALSEWMNVIHSQNPNLTSLVPITFEKL